MLPLPALDAVIGNPPYVDQRKIDKKEKTLAVKWDDEIVKATMLTREGAVVHPSFAPKSAA